MPVTILKLKRRGATCTAVVCWLAERAAAVPRDQAPPDPAALLPCPGPTSCEACGRAWQPRVPPTSVSGCGDLGFLTLYIFLLYSKQNNF